MRAGKCFRLFTLWSFQHQLEEVQTPEIQRSDLGSLILSLTNMGIPNIVNFDFMDAPNHLSLVKAYEQLLLLKALNQEGQITKTGRKMA